MDTYANKAQKNKARSSANALSQKQENDGSLLSSVDNRPEAIAQRKRQEAVNDSPQTKHFSPMQAVANSQPPPIQKKLNDTGLPDNLKRGLEGLSGHTMDDVKVHYNSGKPAQLQAHAYARGTDIHLSTGQEKHLPHEAWHVVQQKQGRVKPTEQLKSNVPLNDDGVLEKEADTMGNKAAKGHPSSSTLIAAGPVPYATVQRVQIDVKKLSPEVAREYESLSPVFKSALLLVPEKQFAPFYALLPEEQVAFFSLMRACGMFVISMLQQKSPLMLTDGKGKKSPSPADLFQGFLQENPLLIQQLLALSSGGLGHFRFGNEVISVDAPNLLRMDAPFLLTQGTSQKALTQAPKLPALLSPGKEPSLQDDVKPLVHETSLEDLTARLKEAQAIEEPRNRAFAVQNVINLAYAALTHPRASLLPGVNIHSRDLGGLGDLLNAFKMAGIFKNHSPQMESSVVEGSFSPAKDADPKARHVRAAVSGFPDIKKVGDKAQAPKNSIDIRSIDGSGKDMPTILEYGYGEKAIGRQMLAALDDPMNQMLAKIDPTLLFKAPPLELWSAGLNPEEMGVLMNEGLAEFRDSETAQDPQARIRELDKLKSPNLKAAITNGASTGAFIQRSDVHFSYVNSGSGLPGTEDEYQYPIKTVMQQVLLGNKHEASIVLPGAPKASVVSNLDVLNLSVLGIKSIRLVNGADNAEELYVSRGPVAAQGKDLRIVYIASLPNQDMQTMMKSTDGPLIVTGDQSLIEAVNRGLPFVYQKIDLKDGLFNSLMRLAADFPLVQAFLDAGVRRDYGLIGTLLQQPALRNQFQRFSKKVTKEHDITGGVIGLAKRVHLKKQNGGELPPELEIMEGELRGGTTEDLPAYLSLLSKFAAGDRDEPKNEISEDDETWLALLSSTDKKTGSTSTDTL